MKKILLMVIITIILSTTLFLYITPVFGELAVEDIEKIRTIVKDELTIIDTKMSEMEKRLTLKIEEGDKRLTDKISELDKRLTSEIRAVDKQLNWVWMLLIALIAAIVLPRLIVALQQKKHGEQNDKIRAQDEKIEVLQREIEALRER